MSSNRRSHSPDSSSSPSLAPPTVHASHDPLPTLIPISPLVDVTIVDVSTSSSDSSSESVDETSLGHSLSRRRSRRENGSFSSHMVSHSSTSINSRLSGVSPVSPSGSGSSAVVGHSSPSPSDTYGRTPAVVESRTPHREVGHQVVPGGASQQSLAYMRSHQKLMREMLPGVGVRERRNLERPTTVGGDEGLPLLGFKRSTTSRRVEWEEMEVRRVRRKVCLTFAIPFTVFCICFALFSFLVVLLLLTYSTQTEVRILDVGPDSELQPMIEPDWTPDQPDDPARWLGGSSASTAFVNFHSGKKWGIFLFGDSIIGHVGGDGARIWDPDECREAGLAPGCGMVHNSIGVLDMSVPDVVGRIHMFWRGRGSDSPEAFISPSPKDGTHYGFCNGVVLEDVMHQFYLFIFTPRFLHSNDSRLLPPPSDGVVVIRCGPLLEETIEDPLSWTCVQHRMPPEYSSADNGFQWGSPGGIIRNENIFLLGIYADSFYQDAGMLLSRMSVASFMAFQWVDLEFWCEGGYWREGRLSVPEDSSMLPPGPLVTPAELPGLPQTYETNMHFNEFLEKFVVVENKPSSDFNSYLFTSPSITGPYTSYYMYSIPPPFSKYQKEMFAYAYKSHNLMTSRNDDMLFTYLLNSPSNFESYLKTYHRFFIPQFIRARLIQRKKSLW